MQVTRIVEDICRHFSVYICPLSCPQQKADQEMKTDPGDWGRGGLLTHSHGMCGWETHHSLTPKEFLNAASKGRRDPLSIEGQHELPTRRKWNKTHAALKLEATGQDRKLGGGQHSPGT